MEKEKCSGIIYKIFLLLSVCFLFYCFDKVYSSSDKEDQETRLNNYLYLNKNYSKVSTDLIFSEDLILIPSYSDSYSIKEYDLKGNLIADDLNVSVPLISSVSIDFIYFDHSWYVLNEYKKEHTMEEGLANIALIYKASNEKRQIEEGNLKSWK